MYSEREKNNADVSQNSQKVAEISNEMIFKNENIISNSDDIIRNDEKNRSIVEEENRRKIKAQLQNLGF